MHLVHSLEPGGMERQLVTVLGRLSRAPATRCGGDHDSMDRAPRALPLSNKTAIRTKHIVCTMRSPGPLRSALPTDVEVLSLNLTGRKTLAAGKLAAVLRRRRIDLVHARNWNTWTDCLLAVRLLSHERPGVVLGFHGRETAAPFSSAQRWRAKLLGLHRQQYPTVSHAGRQQLTCELGAPKDRITLLQNGVDTERFAPPDPRQRAEARQRLGLQPDEFAILMLGSLTPVKDHRTAILAVAAQAAQINHCHLLVAGGGPLRAELEAVAQEFHGQLKTTFLGHCRDPVPLLHGADLLLCTSRYEQMSNALLEAMACGLPIVATDVGDNARITGYGSCGVIVPPADPGETGRAILRCAADRGQRRRLGEQARRGVVDRFRIERTVAAYQRFYTSLLGRVRREARSCAALPVLSRIAP